MVLQGMTITIQGFSSCSVVVCSSVVSWPPRPPRLPCSTHLWLPHHPLCFFRCVLLTRSSRHWRTYRSGAPCVVYKVCAVRAACTHCPTSSTLTKTRKRRRPCPRIIPWGWFRRQKIPIWCRCRPKEANMRPLPHPFTQKLASRPKVGDV